MHIDPVYARLKLINDSSASLEYNVVNFFLLLSEFAINRERNSDIRAVMMQRVTLVSEHHHSVFESFIIVMIMKSGSTRSTSTD